MDQEAFRQTYEQINERVCAFEKGILAGHCGCSLATRVAIAEREGVHCRTDAAQRQCFDLLDLLRHGARFTLKLGQATWVLPHNKAMRLQVGGVRGIYAVLHPEQELPPYIDDIHGLLREARLVFGELEELPFGEIIKQVAAFKGRQRR
jgi:hypothetical protein